MQNKKVFIQDWGLIDYQEAWNRQETILQSIVDIKTNNRNTTSPEATPNYLIVCQHPHVYTLGKSGDAEHLLLNDHDLEEKEARFYKINRGGDITYHGPGQLVGYPILDLDNFFTDIHLYLRQLEEAIILTLKDFGIDAGREKGLTGVWIDVGTPQSRKICAMGVRCSRWVTMHGFALNVSPDLNYFNHIIPCGISDKQVTSMSIELKREVSIAEVQSILLQHIAQTFTMEVIYEST